MRFPLTDASQFTIVQGSTDYDLKFDYSTGDAAASVSETCKFAGTTQAICTETVSLNAPGFTSTVTTASTTISSLSSTVYPIASGGDKLASATGSCGASSSNGASSTQGGVGASSAASSAASTTGAASSGVTTGAGIAGSSSGSNGGSSTTEAHSANSAGTSSSAASSSTQGNAAIATGVAEVYKVVMVPAAAALVAAGFI